MYSTPDLTESLTSLGTAIGQVLKRNTEAIESFQITWESKLESLTSGLSEMSERIAADFAAINLAWPNIISSDTAKKLQHALDTNLAEADAFCAAGWPIAPSMPSELRKRVVELNQQGKTRYVSQTVIGYYRRSDYRNLNQVVGSWRNHPFFTPRFHILSDALEAHRNGKFTLSVPALLPQIEGILSEYVKKNSLVAKFGKSQQVCNAAIGDVDDYGLAEWAIVQTLLYLLNSSTYVYTRFEDELERTHHRRKTSRHTVLHGVATHYHRHSHSLRALLLLDAISVLE